jgi:hypothetical protein
MWTTSYAKKTKDVDLVVCFNVILFCIEICVVKGFYCNEMQSISKKIDGSDNRTDAIGEPGSASCTRPNTL